MLLVLFAPASSYSQVDSDSLSQSDYVSKDLEKEFSGFKNTSVKLRLPKHYKEFSNETLSGYMHTGTASSIVADEMNETPYALTTDKITQDNIEGSGALLVSQEESKTYSGSPAKIYYMEFKVKDVDMIRIMFFTGSYDKTVLLQANYPKSFDKLLRNVIKESFRTVKFD